MSTTKVVPGTLVASPDLDGVAREAAARMAKVIRDAIDARRTAAIALSGGSSPLPAYRKLAAEPGIDWSKVDVFWIDERAVPPGDERSNFGHAKSTLLDPAGVPAERVHRMHGDARDLDAAAREYEAALRGAIRCFDRGVPQLDLAVMGIGDDGHTASLFPGRPEVAVTDRLVVSVPPPQHVEPHVARITCTPPVIEAARAIVVIATGRSKNGPLERTWLISGSASDTPARILRDARGAVSWIIDRAAGGLE
jgi:6-phosphogluconolactonase